MGLLLWLLLKPFNKLLGAPLKKKDYLEHTRVHLLFELGALQVIAFVPFSDMSAQPKVDEVFWRNKHTGYTYGPFSTVTAAMNHYTWLTSLQKVHPKEGTVIWVDFKRKKQA